MTLGGALTRTQSPATQMQCTGWNKAWPAMFYLLQRSSHFPVLFLSTVDDADLSISLIGRPKQFRLRYRVPVDMRKKLSQHAHCWISVVWHCFIRQFFSSLMLPQGCSRTYRGSRSATSQGSMWVPPWPHSHHTLWSLSCGESGLLECGG